MKIRHGGAADRGAEVSHDLFIPSREPNEELRALRPIYEVRSLVQLTHRRAFQDLSWHPLSACRPSEAARLLPHRFLRDLLGKCGEPSCRLALARECAEGEKSKPKRTLRDDLQIDM